MADPFAMAAAALFRAPGSLAAVYVPAQGPAVATRAIRLAESETPSAFDGSRVVQASNSFQLPVADVPNPQPGDGLTVTDLRLGDQSFTIYGDPSLDVEGVSWTCSVNAA